MAIIDQAMLFGGILLVGCVVSGVALLWYAVKTAQPDPNDVYVPLDGNKEDSDDGEAT